MKQRLWFLLVFAMSVVSFATDEFGEVEYQKNWSPVSSAKSLKKIKRSPSTDPKVTVVLDAGHDIKPLIRQGSLSTCGRSEVTYNDAMIEKVKSEFAKDERYNVFLTRSAGKDVTETIKNEVKVSGKVKATDFLFTDAAKKSYAKDANLLGRPLIANYHQCQAVISIHHDAVAADAIECDQSLCATVDEKAFIPNLENQKKETPKGEVVHHPCGRLKKISGGAKLTEGFKKEGLSTGYVLLVHYDNDPDEEFGPKDSRKKESVKLAESIGKLILTNNSVVGGVERMVSNHHTYTKGKTVKANYEDCPSCSFIDDKPFVADDLKKLGILNIKNALMREARCPSILIEVGNTTDNIDEARITNSTFQDEFAKLIKAGTDEYFINLGLIQKK